MSNIRETLAARAATMRREELFEPKMMEGVQVLAVGMMTGEKNRVFTDATDTENRVRLDQLTTRVIAATMCDPETRKPLWNYNSREDHDEINALPSETTEDMVAVAYRVSGIGKEAVSAGKPDSVTPNTSLDSSSQPVLAVA
jgi:hypothetical protein